jgi:AAA domain
MNLIQASESTRAAEPMVSLNTVTGEYETSDGKYCLNLGSLKPAIRHNTRERGDVDFSTLSEGEQDDLEQQIFDARFLAWGGADALARKEGRTLYDPRKADGWEAAQRGEHVKLTAGGILEVVKDGNLRAALKDEAERVLREVLNPKCDVERLQLDFQQTMATLLAGTGSGLPSPIDAACFLADKLDEPKQIVHGLLHQGSKLALGGGSKSYKTWVLLDLSLSIAYGKRWLNFDTTQGKVLFVNFELQDFAIQRRIGAVSEAKGIIQGSGNFYVLNLRGKAADYATLIPKIQSGAKETGFALIVLDPVYKLYGAADENSAGDIAKLCNAFEVLAVETGAAVAFGCHFSKGNQAGRESIDRISGSGVFARDPDSLLVMTKHNDTESHSFAIEATLRNFPPVEDFVVSWKKPLMEVNDSLDPSDLKQSKGGRAKAYDPLKLLAAIKTFTQANPVSLSEWSKLAEIPRPTLADYATEMRLKGWIATKGEGNAARRFITETGLAALSKQEENQ